MDIRVINKNNEIINVTNLSIKRTGRWIIGADVNGNIERIEEYENEEKAEDRLIAFGIAVENGGKLDLKTVLIRT